MSRDSDFEEKQNVSTDNENTTHKEVSKVSSSSTDPRKNWSPMPSPLPARSPIWQWIVTWVLFLSLAGIVIVNNAGYRFVLLDAIFPSATEPAATDPAPTEPPVTDEPAANTAAPPTDTPLPLQIEIQVKPNPDIGLNALIVGFDAIATIKVSQQSGDNWIPIPNKNMKISFPMGETTVVTDVNGQFSLPIGKNDIASDQQFYAIEVILIDENGNLTGQESITNINIITPVRQELPSGSANLLSLSDPNIVLLKDIYVVQDWFDIYLLENLEINDIDYAKVYLVGWIRSNLVDNQSYPDSKNALSVVPNAASKKSYFADDAKGLWNIQLFPLGEQSGNFTKTMIIGLIPSDQLQPAE
jgi:hypothetical protein